VTGLTVKVGDGEMRIPGPFHVMGHCPICGNKPSRGATTFVMPGKKGHRGPGGGARHTLVFKLCNKRCMIGYINLTTLVGL
jgi:hypothetical protein